MLNLGFSELLLIFVAAILFIGPKDYPAVIRAFSKAYREFRGLVDGMRAQVHGVAREAGLHEVEARTRTIIDLEGKPQIAYELDDVTPPAAPKESDRP